MNKKNKNIVLWIIILILLGLLIASFFVDIVENPQSNNMTSTATTQSFKPAKYFQDRIITLGINDIGHPIEGFNAKLIMRAFPAIKPIDFAGVNAIAGHYEYQSGNLAFIRDNNPMNPTSEKTISTKGYGKLLSDISTRLNVEIQSKNDIDELISQLNTADSIVASLNQSGEALGITIVPQAVLGDSRCPIDVECIQAGIVKLSAMVKSDSKSMNIIFKQRMAQTVFGRKITLKQVNPPQISGKTISPNEYEFVFEVKKISQISEKPHRRSALEHITAKKAGQIATNKYGGTVINVESDHYQNNPVWEVEIKNSNKGRIEVKVSKASSTIVAVETAS